MRVLLVTAHFRPHVGGIERFVENLAGGLAGRGHRVTVVCMRTDRISVEEEVDSAGYRIVRVPASTLLERRLGVPYPLPSPRALATVLRRELAAADVVHVQDVLYPTSVLALRQARTIVPSLLTLHVGFVPQGRKSLDTVQRLALRTLGRAVHHASRVVALNEEVARFAKRAWGVTEIGVQPVGVPSPPSIDRDEARAELGLDPGAFVALFVGRDVPKKGLDLLLSATDPAYEILAVTDRRSRPVPGATLRPFVAHDALQRIYAAADAFVLPSVGEGIPVALQEAMAHGLPVVTCYDDGYRESFGPEDVLAVSRSSDEIRAALLQLASDPPLRERLRARSSAVHAARFDLDRFVDRTAELYRTLSP